MRSKLTILKIGGAVITDKSEGAFEVLKEESLREVCRAISERWEGLVVVHGAGSFGHPHVKKYGLNPIGAAKVHLACLRLNEKICSTLTENGVPAYPIHPFISYSTDLVRKALERGFVPVLHGDVVFGPEGVEVLSGDDIVTHLAEELEAEKIGFATDVDGVKDNDSVIEKLDRELLRKLLERKEAASGKKVDVTGGMLRKLQKLYEMKHRCRIFVFKGNYENLKKFLMDEEVGTEVIL